MGLSSMISETRMYLFNGTRLEHTYCLEWLYQFVQIIAILQSMLDIILDVYKTLSAILIKQNRFQFLPKNTQILVLLEICLILDDLCMLVSSFAELTTHLSLLGFHYTSATFTTLSFVTVYIVKKYIL